ncbi:MAG: TetR/AcrR family transcriptional regulator [Oligosphaeraceae bacterium]|nr:TetR/AcrR family transcriptional regulator [Oligosphaeraceae bacterium]
MQLTKRQNEIVDQALSLTAAGGMQNLTVTNLSAALGISEPALYRHFKNKSEIVKAMINRFDADVPTEQPGKHGFEAIGAFIQARLEQVCANPHLARVMFAEEIFMGESKLYTYLLAMMHKHKAELGGYFAEAQAAGEIQPDIPLDTLYRVVMGPVRLLIKQWGMSEGGFDLRVKGAELLAVLRKMLKANPA